MQKALVVDDSKVMCEMVSATLQNLGYESVLAYDGEEAFEEAEKSKFDLIVTDINMPNMDGIELIRLLRTETDCKFVPILVLSTESGDVAKAKAKEAGATGWITKPFKPQILENAVKKNMWKLKDRRKYLATDCFLLGVLYLGYYVNISNNLKKDFRKLIGQWYSEYFRVFFM